MLQIVHILAGSTTCFQEPGSLAQAASGLGSCRSPLFLCFSTKFVELMTQTFASSAAVNFFVLYNQSSPLLLVHNRGLGPVGKTWQSF